MTHVSPCINIAVRISEGNDAPVERVEQDVIDIRSDQLVDHPDGAIHSRA